MKRFVKLLPSFVLLVISAVLLSTSTFAWFSMNNKVTVTGMEVTTKVGNNLYVKASNHDAETLVKTGFTSGIDTNQDVVEIQPSSTIDGVNYFYTYEANEDGSIATKGKYLAVVDNEIEVDDDTTLAAYSDYVIELKAVNAGANPNYIWFNKINLLYNGVTETNKAFRVAIFVQAQDGENLKYIDMAEEATAIYAMTSAEYQTANNAVKAIGERDTAAETGNIAAVKNLGTVIGKAEDGPKMVVAAGEEAYYKVTVRLWLEGEDKDCTSDKFMELTEAWSLDLELTLSDLTTGSPVAVLGSAANAVANVAAKVVAVTLDSDGKLSNGEMPQTYQWYKVVADADDTAVGTEKSFTCDEPTGTYYYYCVIKSTKGSIYKTNTVEVKVTE